MICALIVIDSGWTGCIDDSSFERRLRHRKKRFESLFTGCHSKEVFTVPIVRLPYSYQLVPDWLYDFVEMSPVYPKANTMIYIYFSSATLVVTGVWSHVCSWKTRSKLRRCYFPVDVRNFADFGIIYEENYEKNRMKLSEIV